MGIVSTFTSDYNSTGSEIVGKWLEGYWGIDAPLVASYRFPVLRDVLLVFLLLFTRVFLLMGLLRSDLMSLFILVFIVFRCDVNSNEWDDIKKMRGIVRSLCAV